MISHTKAFQSLKERSQEFFDFVVLVTYAVPAMKGFAAGPGASGGMPPSDFFKKDVKKPGELIRLAGNYEGPLATYITLSAFSFFEAYVVDSLRELIAFHGGASRFEAMGALRAKSLLARSSAQTKDKRKLQEPSKRSHREKYEKHSRLLDAAGYRFPTEHFAPLGLGILVAKVKDKGKAELKAHEIPSVLRGVGVPLTDLDVAAFTKVRETRNRIAHGRGARHTLGDAMKINGKLRELAAKADQHLVEHLFVLQDHL